jgi:hypothetical protein
MVPPTNAAWHSRDILPILRFAEAWDAGSISETYDRETLPDRRSVGIESETTQTCIDWCAPRVTPCLREARSRVGRIRPMPTSSVACPACWKRHIACKLPHEEHQFSATISETRSSIGGGRTHLSITRPGPRRLKCSYGCGQHDKRNRVAAFQLSPRQRKHNLPDQLRVHPRSDRNGIALSNRGRQFRWHRPY